MLLKNNKIFIYDDEEQNKITLYHVNSASD